MQSTPCIKATELQVIGKCKGCSRTHNGPLLLSIYEYGGVICLALAADDNTDHLHPISLIDIRQIAALLSEWEDRHPSG